jgi:DNA replication protein DnaC
MKTIVTISGSDSCEIHGNYAFTAIKVGKIFIGKSCPHCLSARQEDARVLNEKKTLADNEAHKLNALQMAGVPLLFLNSTIASFIPESVEAKNVHGYISAYSNSFHLALKKRPATGLILSGISGTGKTHLACGLISSLIDRGYSATYAAIPGLLTKLREATFGRSESTPTQIIDRLCRPHLLVLDEYGAHTLTDENYQLLFSIIEGRYQRNLPTVLISNLPHENLVKELDPRFIERILGNTNGAILSLKWSTHRMKKNNG